MEGYQGPKKIVDAQDSESLSFLNVPISSSIRRRQKDSDHRRNIDDLLNNQSNKRKDKLQAFFLTPETLEHNQSKDDKDLGLNLHKYFKVLSTRLEKDCEVFLHINTVSIAKALKKDIELRFLLVDLLFELEESDELPASFLVARLWTLINLTCVKPYISVDENAI